MAGSVIVSWARTPIGRLGGALSPLSASTLGGLAIAAALERAGIGPEVVDHVVMGQVLQAGQGQITARQAAVAAGINMDVPALTVNKVCLSGLQALYLADQLIRSGDAEVVVAGGMESMTNAPHLLPGARSGFRLGDARLVDSMIQDGLWCAFDGIHMGAGTERDSAVAGIGREAQDSYAARSHERAAAAVKAGRLTEEIVPVEVARAKGAPILVEADEGIRPGTTVERLSTLAPAFAPAGTVTAGNASQISDGAAALVVTSWAGAERLGAEPLAELVG
ncbi:MAG: acetyl-CoA C-acyltransferase, partial [Acidimicrobiia bacterium]